VGVSDSPERVSARQRDLRAQLEVLDGLGGEPLDHPEQLGRVLADTDRLMQAFDEIEAVAARRRRRVAYGLLAVAAVLTVLVVVRVLPAVVLLGAVLLLAAAAGLLIGTRNAPAVPS
jgi:hypothetical protein